MMTNTDRDSIGKLGAFALNHGYVQFAHLCTAALNGEEWAIQRVHVRLLRLDWLLRSACLDSMSNGDRQHMVREFRLDVIRSTDTTRPDGATARGFKI